MDKDYERLLERRLDKLIDEAREIEDIGDIFVYKVECLKQNKKISKLKKSGE